MYKIKVGESTPRIEKTSLQEIVNLFRENKTISLDTEGRVENFSDNKVLRNKYQKYFPYIVSLYFPKGNIIVILKIEHLLERIDDSNLLIDLFAEKRIIIHNALFDITAIFSYANKYAPPPKNSEYDKYVLFNKNIKLFCPLLAARMYFSGMAIELLTQGKYIEPFSLKSLLRIFYKIDVEKSYQKSNWGEIYSIFDDYEKILERSSVIFYSALDSFYAWLLWLRLGFIENTLAGRVEMEALNSFYLMSRVGLSVNRESLEDIRDQYSAKKDEYQKAIKDYFIERLPEEENKIQKLNINSPKQLLDLLNKIFNKENVTIDSTNISTISEIPIIGDYLSKYRFYSKLLSQAELFISMLDLHKKYGAEEDFISINISPLVFKGVGRTASKYGLQQLASSSPDTGIKGLKQAFLNSDDKNIFFKNDLAAAHANIAFSLSRFKLTEGIKPHHLIVQKMMAQKGVEIDISEVIKKCKEDKEFAEAYDLAKKVFYSKLNGTSIKTLSKLLKIDVEQAREFNNAFLKSFPSLNALFTKFKNKSLFHKGDLIEEQVYVLNINCFGEIRRLNEEFFKKYLAKFNLVKFDYSPVPVRLNVYRCRIPDGRLVLIPENDSTISQTLIAYIWLAIEGTVIKNALNILSKKFLYSFTDSSKEAFVCFILHDELPVRLTIKNESLSEIERQKIIDEVKEIIRQTMSLCMYGFVPFYESESIDVIKEWK